MDVLERQEFKFTHYNSPVQLIKYYTMGTPHSQKGLTRRLRIGKYYKNTTVARHWKITNCLIIHIKKVLPS